MTKHLFLRASLVFSLCFALCGCARTPEPEQVDYFAMDTFFSLRAYGKNAKEALAECREETRRIDALLSVTNESSDIYRINHADGAQTEVSAETAALLSDAFSVSRDTDGCFDPTVYPLVECWGFFSDEKHVPSPQEIEALLPTVGCDRVQIVGNAVSLPSGAGIDLGGVAKGYATDRLVARLRERGVTSALLSLGGNLYALGEKPDGSLWRIGVQDPFDESAITGLVRACNQAVITSGSYQRYFVQNGVTYHHILDPKTGCPAKSDLSSVTVICENATLADALSTALFVMGSERATAYWRAHADTFAAVFVLCDATVAYTENARFEPARPDARKISK